MRSGELAGLKWGDIDLNGKFLIVRRNYTRGRLEKTKTDRATRKIAARRTTTPQDSQHKNPICDNITAHTTATSLIWLTIRSRCRGKVQVRR